MAFFNEKDHPRADDGKFTNKDGGGSSSTDKSNYSDDVSTPEKKAQWLRNRIEDLKQKDKENPSSETKSWIKDYQDELNELEGTKTESKSYDKPLSAILNQDADDERSNGPLKIEPTKENFRAFVKELKEKGVNFHPDDDFADYGIFNGNQVEKLNEQMDDFATELGDDIYNIAMEEFKEPSAAEKLGVERRGVSNEMSADSPLKLAKKMASSNPSNKQYETLQMQVGQEIQNAKNRGASPKELRDINNEYRNKMNQLAADDPRKLANKMEQGLKKTHDANKRAAQIHSQNYTDEDKQVISMINEGKTNEEIKRYFSENDETGEFDEYEAENYIENLRQEKELLEEDGTNQITPTKESSKVEPLSDEYFEEYYKKSGGDEDLMLDMIRKDKRVNVTNGDLQGMIEVFMMNK